MIFLISEARFAIKEYERRKYNPLQPVYRDLTLVRSNRRDRRGEKKKKKKKTFATRQISRGSLQLGVHDARWKPFNYTAVFNEAKHGGWDFGGCREP